MISRQMRRYRGFRYQRGAFYYLRTNKTSPLADGQRAFLRDIRSPLDRHARRIDRGLIIYSEI